MGTARTIAALREAGRLSALDAASVALARTTADALDAATSAMDRGFAARVHMAALGALLAGAQPPQSDDLDSFLASLRATPLGDPAKP